MKLEMIKELQQNLTLADNLQNDSGRKCKRFFEIIRSIRVTTQIITELLRRIEVLEEEINNLKIK